MGKVCFSNTTDQADKAGHPIPNDDSVDGGLQGSSDEVEKAKELSYEALQYDLLHRQHLSKLQPRHIGSSHREKEEIDAAKGERDREMTRKLLPSHKSCFFTGCLYEQLTSNVVLRKRNEPYAKVIAPAMECYINYENAEIRRSDESSVDFNRLESGGLQFKMDSDSEAFQRGEVNLCLDHETDARSSIVSLGYNSTDYTSSTTVTDASVYAPQGRRRRRNKRGKHLSENPSGATDANISSSDEEERTGASSLFPASERAAWTTENRTGVIMSNIEIHQAGNRQPNAGSTTDSGMRSSIDTAASLTDLTCRRTTQSELHRFIKHFKDIAFLLGNRDLANHHTSRYHMVNYETRTYGNSAHYRFIPTITVPFWPNECHEWVTRERVPIKDVRLNRVYVWPTKDMVERAKLLGCHLIPKLPDRSSNPSGTHSWTMNFIKVEAFLMRTLRHSQIRCYLFCIVLYKMYLEDPKAPLINVHHIQHILFHMCEDEPQEWPEDQLAERIFHVMKSLLRALEKRRLQNYFMKKMNNLENIPMQQILRMQKRVSELLENWTMSIFHVLEGLSSLEFASGFYPKFPFESLYHYLTTGKQTLLVQMSEMSFSEQSEIANGLKNTAETRAGKFFMKMSESASLQKFGTWRKSD
ncbi:unnamed protein product [Darwinula stevensoni]|uniref:Mab-21-like HhH/H2TH-like domain-containing protein n=1 Tax=Darwinula stevensoni TaxID=69355 RepID=A0A7R9ADP9_9CRUS|nr:unnamed protein product [Darwinula stevensoni]CAG0901303.1 unnamed protein product [Darwinula stevensoni]